jgi:hypothetical protein
LSAFSANFLHQLLIGTKCAREAHVLLLLLLLLLLTLVIESNWYK